MATNSTIVKFVEISRASFDALSTKDGNTLYVVKESNGTRKFYQGQYNLTGVDASTLQTSLNAKQNTLVSGSNIKTVNGNSLLGSGNIAVQPTLVSGTNIKTVNGNSLLGSGNITISGGGGTPSWQLVRTVTGTPDGGYIYFNGLLNSLTNGAYMIQLTFTEDIFIGVNYNMTFLFERYGSGTSIGFPILIDGAGGGTVMYSLTNEGDSTSAYISEVDGVYDPSDIIVSSQIKLYRKVY